jgi:hypothetical protein
VRDRFGPQFLRSIPMSGTPMQLGKFMAKLGLKPPPQMFGEKWMVAIPLTFIVKRSSAIAVSQLMQAVLGSKSPR